MIKNLRYLLQNQTTETLMSKAASNNATSPNTAFKMTDSKKGLAPAALVEISDLAKTLLSRRTSAAAAAENLKTAISATNKNDTDQYSSLAPRNYSTLTPISFFDSLMPPGGKDMKPDGKWQPGAPYGDATKSDAWFIRDLGLSSLSMDAAGWPPEVGQTLDNAIRTRTIKIQKASDIEGLNFKSSKTFTPNKNNGAGYDTTGGTSQNPVGDTKKTLDSGRALAMWTADRGNVYLSW